MRGKQIGYLTGAALLFWVPGAVIFINSFGDVGSSQYRNNSGVYSSWIECNNNLSHGESCVAETIAGTNLTIPQIAITSLLVLAGALVFVLKPVRNAILDKIELWANAASNRAEARRAEELKQEKIRQDIAARTVVLKPKNRSLANLKNLSNTFIISALFIGLIAVLFFLFGRSDASTLVVANGLFSFAGWLLGFGTLGGFMLAAVRAILEGLDANNYEADQLGIKKS